MIQIHGLHLSECVAILWANVSTTHSFAFLKFLSPYDCLCWCSWSLWSLCFQNSIMPHQKISHQRASLGDNERPLSHLMAFFPAHQNIDRLITHTNPQAVSSTLCTLVISSINHGFWYIRWLTLFCLFHPDLVWYLCVINCHYILGCQMWDKAQQRYFMFIH